MADGRHFEKKRQSAISTQQWPVSAKFGMMTHLCSLQPTDRWNFEFLKIKMAAAAILENRKIAISQQRLYWSTQNSVRWCRISPKTTRSLKNLNSKVPDSGRPPFWKPLNRNISSSVWPFWWNVEWWRLLPPPPGGDPPLLKFRISENERWLHVGWHLETRQIVHRLWAIWMKFGTMPNAGPAYPGC